jgi:hypothetical protein
MPNLYRSSFGIEKRERVWWRSWETRCLSVTVRRTEFPVLRPISNSANLPNGLDPLSPPLLALLEELDISSQEADTLDHPLPSRVLVLEADATEMELMRLEVSEKLAADLVRLTVGDVENRHMFDDRFELSFLSKTASNRKEFIEVRAGETRCAPLDGDLELGCRLLLPIGEDVAD